MMYLPGIFGDDLMNDFFEDDFFRVPSQQSRTGLMKTDIRKLDGEYELDIELPGYKKDDVQIELNQGNLTIKASRGSEKDEKDGRGKIIRRERYNGSVERSFYLGEDISDNEIRARFEDGILKITVPDPEKKIPEKKTISIEG